MQKSPLKEAQNTQNELKKTSAVFVHFCGSIDFIDKLSLAVYMLPELYQSQLHFVLGLTPLLT